MPTPEQLQASVDKLAASYDHGTAGDITPADQIQVANAPTPEPKPEPTPAAKPRNEDGTFAPVAKADAAPKHPAYLVKMAKDRGYSDEDIASFDAEQLGTAIMVYDRNAHAAAVQTHMRSEREQTAPTREAAPAPAPVDEDALGIDGEDEYDPSVVKLLKSMRKEIKELREKVGGIDGHLQKQRDTEAYNKLDAFFNKHKNIYGEGSREDLKDGPHLRRRLAFIRELKEGGIQANTESELFSKVHATFYGDVQTSTPSPQPQADPKPRASGPTPEQIEAKKREWLDDGPVATPSHRADSPEPPSRAKAIKAVEAQLRERNGATIVHADDGDDTI